MSAEAQHPSFDQILTALPYYLAGVVIFFIISTYFVHRKGWSMSGGVFFAIVWPFIVTIAAIVTPFAVAGVLFYVLMRMAFWFGTLGYRASAKIWGRPPPKEEKFPPLWGDDDEEEEPTFEQEMTRRFARTAAEKRAKAGGPKAGGPKVNVAIPKNQIPS